MRVFHRHIGPTFLPQEVPIEHIDQEGRTGHEQEYDCDEQACNPHAGIPSPSKRKPAFVEGLCEPPTFISIIQNLEINLAH